MGDLFQRGEIWYTHVFEDGKRRMVSTRCEDRKAAETIARQLERDAADPEAARLRNATLGAALLAFLKAKRSEAKAGKLSAATVTFYERKVGHLARVLEHDSKGRYQPMRLAKLGARNVDAYIEQRRDEGVTDHTIKKELVALQGTLKLAKRRGIWRGDIDAVMPDRFSPNYKPRERALTIPELQKLLAKLTPDHAARVACCVATSAEWGVTEPALREDVDLHRMEVFLRGTKRKTRRRTVPVVFPPQQGLLHYPLEYADGTDGMLFAPWTNARRDLQTACDAAGIERCSFNDLRRTAATWLRRAGVPLELLAPITGHSSTRMLEQVYARFTTESLAIRISATLGLPAPAHAATALSTDTGTPSNCSAYAADCSASAANSAALGGAAALSTDDGIEKPRENAGSSVPRDGIEPPTRGFSIPCSTN